MPRAQRRCGQPGCDEYVPCPTHARAPDRRPPANQRGYDSTYEAAKNDPAYVAATHCETCGKRFHPGRRKTAGHRKDIRAGGTTADGIFPQCHQCNYGWRRRAP